MGRSPPRLPLDLVLQNDEPILTLKGVAKFQNLLSIRKVHLLFIKGDESVTVNSRDQSVR